MHRTPIRLLAASLTAFAIMSAPLAANAAASTPTGPATVQLRSTGIGMILVNSTGRTLFGFTKDTLNQDNCVTTPFCRIAWPPLLTLGAPVAGPGVDASLLSTITLPSGMQQVTYAGHPLYGYILNIFPGMTGYVGISAFGGIWEALDASGNLIP